MGCLICTSSYNSEQSKYNNPNIIAKDNYLDTLFKMEILHRTHIKSNIMTFDKFFFEGFQPGLYVIGAEPGMGKTTLCLQLADNFAKAGNHVAYFSLEMSESELIKKSFSRMSYLDNICSQKYDYNEIGKIIHDKEEDSIKLKDEYLKSIYPRLNIITPTDRKKNICVDNLKATFVNYWYTHRLRPIVIIDYLQLLKVTDGDESDGVRLDTSIIINVLKDLSKQYQVPVFVISALNRASYSTNRKNKDEMIGLDCFKETGGIEYTADCLMVLTNNDSFDEEEIDVDINILKNKYGPKNVKIPFTFIPKYNCFKEKKEEEI